MSRAVVLGGGGPVGIGWEAGLIVGLARGGVELAAADSVVGTSAGSVVGMILASGGDLTEATELVRQATPPPVSDPAPDGPADGIEQLLASVAEAARDPEAAPAVRARLGRLARQADTIGEEAWIAMFGSFAGDEWPERFCCTAVDVEDGRFKVWSRSDGVDVQRAVASSCAVPCVFPPVRIGDRQWMDGGVRDMLNADVAAGHGTVLAVSCTVLDLPPGLDLPAMESVFAATKAQLDGLRSGGAEVETVIPGAEMLEISGWGLNLMDFSRAGAAFEAGVRQGEDEATRLAGFWA